MTNYSQNREYYYKYKALKYYLKNNNIENIKGGSSDNNLLQQNNNLLQQNNNLLEENNNLLQQNNNLPEENIVIPNQGPTPAF